MKTLNGKRPFSYKDLLYKTLIFITTVSIIVYFLPKEGKFNYDEFAINTPWKYGLLQASFDFPIYKNEQQVQKEQDSILATYQPYFHLDKEIGKNMQKKLREDYNKNLRNILPVTNYIRYIERTLENIYNHGILSAEDAALINGDSIKLIQLIDKNIGTEKSTTELYTIKKAYEHLLNVDTAYYDKRILQLCNLNDYLSPNLIYDKEKSESAKKDLLSKVSWSNGYVLNGQKIIDRGEIINEPTIQAEEHNTRRHRPNTSIEVVGNHLISVHHPERKFAKRILQKQHHKTQNSRDSDSTNKHCCCSDKILCSKCLRGYSTRSHTDKRAVPVDEIKN